MIRHFKRNVIKTETLLSILYNQRTMLIERSTIDDNIRIRIKFLFFSPFKILRDYRKSHEIRGKKNPRNCFANQKARPLTWDRFFTREKEKKKRKMLVSRPEVNYYGFKVSPMANLARNSAEFHFFFYSLKCIRPVKL